MVKDILKDMTNNKCYREYLKIELQKCGSKLPTLKDDKERYMICLSYMKYLKRCIRSGISKTVDNYVEVHADICVEELI